MEQSVNTQPLLEIRDLHTHFFTSRGEARAVDGVDLVLHPGETLGVVGESGCGKTMLSLSVLRLVPDPPGRIVGGQVLFRGKDLLALDEKGMRKVRGNQISMIFQEPMTSLNPVFTVGEQIAEAIRLHQDKGKAEAMDMARDLLALVNIPRPGERLKSYPHELSGGMRQRVVIAMALACDPDVILADEPTTALDVTIQAQILRLMLDLRQRKGAAVLLITHDLGVVAQTCERVMVMYAGRMVETGAVEDLFREPLHPYTVGLMRSLPKPEGDSSAEETVRRERLLPIEGTVPGLLDLPSGCTFHPRCPKAFDRCPREEPPLLDVQGRGVRCWLYDR
jgi:oligopeptide/dipeptide ABC transporter ATP-binding protein